ncbi:MAG: hypothetical protein IPK14_06280 [Blastocatellia bacterium]|nr:hypothetical protein [Blastocatellia bacterium]
MAVPKLARSLLEDKNIIIKTNIIRVLDKIHTKAAQQALEQTLAVEKKSTTTTLHSSYTK